MHGWFHLYDILEMIKLSRQKTDQCLPRARVGRGVDSSAAWKIWEVTELFCVFTVMVYMFVKTHRIVHHNRWDSLYYTLILQNERKEYIFVWQNHFRKKDKIQITRCIRKRKWGNTRKKYKHVNNAPGVYWMEDALVLSHYYTSLLTYL